MDQSTSHSDVYSRIWQYQEVPKRLQSYASVRVVLVGGCFDVLHAAHVQFLTRARAEGDILIVALESDEFISEVKKREPIHSQHERAFVLASLRMVEVVVMLPRLRTHEEYDTLVRLIRPHVIGITQGDEHFAQKEKQARLIGARIAEVTSRIPQLSTSHIISHESFSRSKNSL